MFEGWCAVKVLWSAIAMDIGNGDSCGSKDKRVN